jgi:hypothetical protein
MVGARNMGMSTSGMILTSENRNTPKKRGEGVMFATNPIHTGLGLNSGLNGERPVTNQLNCGTGN